MNHAAQENPMKIMAPAGSGIAVAIMPLTQIPIATNKKALDLLI